MKRKKLAPIHPGEFLQEEFLEPMVLSQYRLAKGLKVSARRINEIVQGKRAITPGTALRLAQFFGTTAQFWLSLQSHFDLETELDRLGGELQHHERGNRVVPSCPVKTEPTIRPSSSARKLIPGFLRRYRSIAGCESASTRRTPGTVSQNAVKAS